MSFIVHEILPSRAGDTIYLWVSLRCWYSFWQGPDRRTLWRWGLSSPLFPLTRTLLEPSHPRWVWCLPLSHSSSSPATSAFLVGGASILWTSASRRCQRYTALASIFVWCIDPPSETCLEGVLVFPWEGEDDSASVAQGRPRHQMTW